MKYKRFTTSERGKQMRPPHLHTSEFEDSYELTMKLNFAKEEISPLCYYIGIFLIKWGMYLLGVRSEDIPKITS